MKQTKCPVCKVKFFVSPSRLKKRYKGKLVKVYCSKECSFKGRNTELSKQCKTCNKTFKFKASRLKYGGRKYCSKECYGKNNRESNHYLWSGGKYTGDKVSYGAIHKWVRRNLGSAKHCEHCGLDKLPKGKKRFFDWANISRKYKYDLSD